MLYVIVKSREDLLRELKESDEPAIQCLVKVMDLFSQGQTAKGKGVWLQDVAGFDCKELTWDVWGSEDARILCFLDVLQEHHWSTACSRKDCPKPVKARKKRQMVWK
jgi:hypothetical protein